MPSIFTRERVAYYCIVLLIAALGIQLFSLIRSRQIGGDFVTIYAEGKVALHYPHSELYNLDIQEKEYAKVWGATVHSPFAYTPWFTIPLAGLARLPYLVAFAVWTSLSMILLVLGFWLAARALGLPSSWNDLGSLACLTFPPYLFYSLLNGQPSSFALFILASSYWLNKNGRGLSAGMALALLTYKPTLLLFIVPMLFFTRQWRLLGGLIIGGAMLALVSLFWAGVEGATSFLRLMALYTQAINSQVEVFQTHKYIDIGAAARLLIGPHPVLRWLLLVLVFPFACFLWYRIGARPLSWSLAIVFGLLLNLYTPIYDSTLLIFAVILIGVKTLDPWLVIALYLVPLVTVPTAEHTGIQLYTIVLITLSIVLIRRSFSSEYSALKLYT